MKILDPISNKMSGCEWVTSSCKWHHDDETEEHVALFFWQV